MNRDMFRLAYSVSMLEGTDTAEASLYGEIIDNEPEFWKWSKEDKSASDFDKEIKKVKESGAKNLLLRINSPGGVCTQATAMRSILAGAGFDSITIRIEGLCASAATTVATVPGATVEIAEGSEYMIHNPWCCVAGSAEELEHAADRLHNIEKMTRGFYTTRTGQTDEQVKEWMDAETWFTAEQAVEYGFADKLLKAEAPAAACVSQSVMDAMRGMYKSVPQNITVSNGTPRAGEPTEINHHNEEVETMDAITMEQLSETSPDLIEQIRQSAVAAERERLADIDALTVPGYEEMAQAAKQDGTSAFDFQKQLVTAMKEKGKAFIQNRQEETKPADNVPGAAPAGGIDEEQEIRNAAKDIAKYAESYAGTDKGMF